MVNFPFSIFEEKDFQKNDINTPLKLAGKSRR